MSPSVCDMQSHIVQFSMLHVPLLIESAAFHCHLALGSSLGLTNQRQTETNYRHRLFSLSAAMTSCVILSVSVFGQDLSLLYISDKEF